MKGLFPADVGGPPTKEAASPSQVEEILAEESVNYLFRFAAIGGRMKITTHKVYWRSRDTLEEAHKVDIALADIGEVSTFKKLGLIDNGLLIRTKRGVEYKFICFVKSKRNNLVKILNSETGQS